MVRPRPHAIPARTENAEAFKDLAQHCSDRHRLPPGITGWAQIHRYRIGVAHPEALDGRIESDLWCIENWFVWLDLNILMRMPGSLLDSANAN